MSELSFKEKSILGSLIVIVVISANYFYRVFSAVAQGPLDRGEMVALGSFGSSLLVALIILEIVYHAMIAGIFHAQANDPTDERDRLIAAKAGRNAGVILAIGCIWIVGHILLNVWFEENAWITPFVTAHLILLSMVAAQVAEYVSQLLYYRRGV